MSGDLAGFVGKRGSVEAGLSRKGVTYAGLVEKLAQIGVEE